ncbi:hypothetical protein PG995_007680 [Apiospora arundinis]
MVTTLAFVMSKFVVANRSEVRCAMEVLPFALLFLDNLLVVRLPVIFGLLFWFAGVALLLGPARVLLLVNGGLAKLLGCLRLPLPTGVGKLLGGFGCLRLPLPTGVGNLLGGFCCALPLRPGCEALLGVTCVLLFGSAGVVWVGFSI